METSGITQFIVDKPVSVKASFVAGEGVDPIIRRLSAEYDVISCYKGLVGKLGQIFPGLTEDNFTVQWIDEDGDPITISTDDDITLALQSIPPGATLNIVIRDVGQSGLFHPGVFCDVCNRGIYGHRYKCMACRDYDLCSECEKSGAHPHHNMMRITTPRTQSNVFDECYGSPFTGRLVCPPWAGLGGPWRKCPGPSNTSCGGNAQPKRSQDCPFAEMNKQAAKIMKNWCEAMGHQAAGDEREKSDDDSGATSSPGEKKEQEAGGEGEDNAALFAAMLGEVFDGFSKTMKHFEGKRQHESQGNEGESEPKHARSCSQEEPAEGDSNAPFDFTAFQEMLAPMAQRLFEGRADASKECQETGENSKTGEPREESEKEENVPPAVEDSMRQGAPAFFRLLKDVLGQGAPAAREGQGDSDDMKAGGEEGGNARPHSPPSPGSPSGGTGPSPFEFCHDLLKSYSNVMKPNSTASDHDDRRCRVARSLQQLQMMGFTDENGWLTSLVETKEGDIGQVLDAIFPAKM